MLKLTLRGPEALEAVEPAKGLTLVYIGDPVPELQRLTQPDLRHMGDLWLLSHPDLRDNARLQAARQAMTEALQAKQDLFEGRCVDGPERPESAPSEDRGPTVGLGGG